MVKRGKLEILKDTLWVIKENRNFIKPTVLLRKSKMSSLRFKDYYNELLKKGFIYETYRKEEKFISLTQKGYKFLDRYRTIVDFIEEFDL